MGRVSGAVLNKDKFWKNKIHLYQHSPSSMKDLSTSVMEGAKESVDGTMKMENVQEQPLGITSADDGRNPKTLTGAPEEARQEP